jgi:hypothetical protein
MASMKGEDHYEAVAVIRMEELVVCPHEIIVPVKMIME